jgi:hypothetical protein
MLNSTNKKSGTGKTGFHVGPNIPKHGTSCFTALISENIEAEDYGRGIGY